MKLKEDYHVRVATPIDATMIFAYWNCNFDEDEPMMKSLKPNCSEPFDEEDSTEDWEEEKINSLFSLSLVALDNEKVIGFVVTKVLEQSEVDTMYMNVEEFYPKSLRNAVEKMQNFLKHVASECKISSTFPECGKVLLIDVIYVDRSYRGKGIAKRLLEKTRELGKKNGCNYIKVIASSHFTALALDRLGFEKIYSIDYKDYKVNDEVVFNIEPPHTSLAIYFQKI